MGLTELNIAVNWIKDEGITAICNAVQGNKESKLATLNVACSAMSPVGARAVAAMVAVTGGLTSLDLSNNAEGLTAEGITAIGDALRVNGTAAPAALLQACCMVGLHAGHAKAVRISQGIGCSGSSRRSGSSPRRIGFICVFGPRRRTGNGGDRVTAVPNRPT